MNSRWASVLFATCVLTGCSAGGQQDDLEVDCSDGQCDQLPSQALCEWQIQGTGRVDIEREYLPRVVACENGNASFEALKAQAIAARSYLYYIARVEKRKLVDGQGDQVFSCGRSPGPEHIRAVEETAGQIVRYRDSYVASFYVAGATQSAPSCEGGSNDPTRTERFVTYNAGRSGDDVTQSTLGFVSKGNLANRGCMSQNGASCLGDIGFDHEEILRYYYGEDIEMVQTNGPCIAGGGQTEKDVWIGTVCEGDKICQTFNANGEDGDCYEWFDEDTRTLAGFCSVTCLGFCPDASGFAQTMCVETDADVGHGQCVPESASSNNFCRDIPGTTNKVSYRFTGDTGAPDDLRTVCAPPQTPDIECNAAGIIGECINTDRTNCGGDVHTGLCPGAANIRCCTP